MPWLRPELSETLCFETDTKTWVVSVWVQGLKAESHSQCLRPQIKVKEVWKNVEIECGNAQNEDN